MTARQSRAERLRMPRVTEVMEAVAVDYGVCIRPLTFRVIDPDTGTTRIVDRPCNATLASKCPSCAERNRRVRMAQCMAGWHLDAEPEFTADDPTEDQKSLATSRADVQAERDHADASGLDTTELDDELVELDDQLAQAGVRGKAMPNRPERRVRSTRRRDDAPELPRRPVDKRTVGRVFRSPDGKVFRPSMGVTLTLGSYGRVWEDGTPVDPGSYDYVRAARDAIHFSKGFDRWVQTLRRFVGYDVQYFASIEPQKRLAPHVHLAMRGTVSRAELRAITAATYASVWWPTIDQPVYVDQEPQWSGDELGYVDPATGQALVTFGDALDALDDDAEPYHVVRFGSQLHAEGVIAGTEQADKWIGYVAKYLTKSAHECHQTDTDRQRAHLERLWETLRFEPCSPTCCNWLSYGIQPRHARSEMKAGYCKSKHHRRETLGFGGRRVLVSRKWSGKTVADHKRDQRQWVLDLLGISATDEQADRLVWEPVKPGDPDVAPREHRLMRAISERARWRQILDDARRRAAGEPPPELSATEQAA